MAAVASLAAARPFLAGPVARVSRRNSRTSLLVRAEEASNGAATTAAPPKPAAAPAAEAKPAAAAATAVKERKPSPLQRGGTLSGAQAAGKDASEKFKAMAEGKESAGPVMQLVDGRFKDYRWVGGRWDLSHFKDAKTGETNWDAVIDAEMARRKLLEDSPIPCTNEEPVLFDTAEIPWWAWVRRFHLPEAEKLNGRAAMVGYVAALFVDQLTGAGLVDQQSSFLGKIALFLSVLAILVIRKTEDIDNIKNLIDEATFYDKQWNATWEGQVRPSEEDRA